MEITDAEIRVLAGLARCFKRTDTVSLSEWASEMGFEYGTITWYKPRLIAHDLIGTIPGKIRSTFITTKGRELLNK